MNDFVQYNRDNSNLKMIIALPLIIYLACFFTGIIISSIVIGIKHL